MPKAEKIGVGVLAWSWSIEHGFLSAKLKEIPVGAESKPSSAFIPERLYRKFEAFARFPVSFRNREEKLSVPVFSSFCRREEKETQLIFSVCRVPNCFFSFFRREIKSENFFFVHQEPKAFRLGLRKVTHHSRERER